MNKNFGGVMRVLFCIYLVFIYWAPFVFADATDSKTSIAGRVKVSRGTYDYEKDLGNLGQGLVDNVVGGGVKSGYVFDMGANKDPNQYPDKGPNKDLSENKHIFRVPVTLENLSPEVDRFRISVAIYFSNNQKILEQYVDKNVSHHFGGEVFVLLMKTDPVSNKLNYVVTLTLCSSSTCYSPKASSLTPYWATPKKGSAYKVTHEAELLDQSEIDVPELFMTGMAEQIQDSESQSRESRAEIRASEDDTEPRSQPTGRRPVNARKVYNLEAN